MAKTLNMTFALDSGKTATVSLAEPKDELGKSEVETAMQTVIEKQALLVGTAVPTAIKSATIREVVETKLI